MDIGSSQEDLEAQFGDKLDYSQMHEGWMNPKGLHATDTETLLKRGGKMRQYLKDRPEKNIVVGFLLDTPTLCAAVLTKLPQAVFHGSFVHYVTGNLKDGEKVGEYCLVFYAVFDNVLTMKP